MWLNVACNHINYPLRRWFLILKVHEFIQGGNEVQTHVIEYTFKAGNGASLAGDIFLIAAECEWEPLRLVAYEMPFHVDSVICTCACTGGFDDHQLMLLFFFFTLSA